MEARWSRLSISRRVALPCESVYGRQRAADSLAGFPSTTVGSPPPALAKRMSQFPKRLLSNAIRMPSGDQTGPLYAAGNSVMFTSPPSSRFATNMSHPNPRRLSNAIREPSGDHAGLSSNVGLSETFMRWDPSIPIT